MEQRRAQYKIRHANILIGVMSGSLWLMIAIGVSTLLTGCGVSAEVFRLDEYHKQSRVDTAPMKPFKCWFFVCPRSETTDMGS